MEARKQGQPSRSKLDAHAAFILGLIEDAPDITLAEIGERLAAERGVRAASSTVRLYLDRRGITFQKKTAHAAEQQRPNVLRRRRSWFDGQLDLDPERLIFIDETAASIKMARLRGRSLRGERLSGGRSSRPLEDHHIHGRPAAGRLGGANSARRPYEWFWLPRLCAAGPRTRASPRRHRGHGQPARPKISGAREVIEQLARLLFLPPYSPDFNPIEMAFSKLKALLRRAATRTIDEFWSVVANCLAAFTAEECTHHVEADGNDPE